MLKLSTSFSKKVPVPDQDFSSQSYHAAVEVELSDALTPEQVQERIHGTFEMVRNAVEVELTGNSCQLPTGSSHAAPPATPNGNGQTLKITNRQAKFITDLATQQGFKLSELNANVGKLYGVSSLYDLDRKQASALLDSLQQKKAA